MTARRGRPTLATPRVTVSVRISSAARAWYVAEAARRSEAEPDLARPVGHAQVMREVLERAPKPLLYVGELNQAAMAWLEEVADRYDAPGPAVVARLLLEDAARDAADKGDSHRLPERVRIGLEGR